MKAEEVMNLLQISRKTLHVYAKAGRIRYTVMPNKRYNYNEEDVYKILNKDVKRFVNMVNKFHNLNIIDGNKSYTINTNSAVLIDIFRATTSIVVMLHKKAKEILPFDNEFSALEFFKSHNDYILVGEKDGIKIKNFDYNNSPSELMNADLDGKSVIFVSTNGTRILKNIKSKKVYMASFLNADLIVEKITNEDPLVCANRRDFFAIEDFVFASYIKARKLNIYVDFNRLKDIILKSKSAQRLRSLNADEDIEISLKLNFIPLMPVYEDGKITKKELE